MALEQAVNLHSKSKVGIIEISQNPQAVHRWFLTSHETCCHNHGLNEAKENSAHKEGISTRINRVEGDVQKTRWLF